jgi:hypothetical protein
LLTPCTSAAISPTDTVASPLPSAARRAGEKLGNTSSPRKEVAACRSRVRRLANRNNGHRLIALPASLVPTSSGPVPLNTSADVAAASALTLSSVSDPAAESSSIIAAGHLTR